MTESRSGLHAAQLRPSSLTSALGRWHRLALGTRVAFFFSGVSALFYQVIWLRELSTVFGNTTLAISVTLTAFMSGLAIGSYVFGRLGDRMARPLRTYALLELAIGIYGLASLSLLRAVHAGYVGLAHRLPFDSPWLVSFQFWASFLVLLVPTALMGGTLPVAVKGLVRRIDTVGEEVGKLYGINTFGAATGVLLVGFFLLPVLGLRGSVALAALINLAVGFVILRLDAPVEPAAPQSADVSPAAMVASDPPPADEAPSPSRALIAILVGGFALSGFAGLALEVAWTRALSLYTGSSVYAFSAVLLAILIGIALGSIMVARADRVRPVTLGWFAAAQLAAAAATLALVFDYNFLAFTFLHIVSRLAGTYPVLLTFEVLIIVGCLLVPTLCSGAAFPILSRIYVRRSDALSRSLGFLYAANTFGCILGAFAAGFLLIPEIGLRSTVLLCAGFYTLTGAAVLLANRDSRTLGTFFLVSLLAIIFLLPPWRPELMSAGFFRNLIDPKTAAEYVEQERKVLFYREGSLATVAVAQVGSNHSLVINGKVDASDVDEEMDTQTLLAHLPLLFAPRRDSALVVGLGSGTTSGAAALHPVRSIDCIEIEPVVAQAARHFRHINRDVLSNPRFHLIAADARNYLAATPKRYDVIMSEPSNPWVAGVASLFTVEHFQALRDRLADDGIICQWVQIYQMSPDDLASIIASFVKVFPDGMLWSVSRNNVDVALIAQRHPWKVDFPRLVQRVRDLPEIRAELRRDHLDSPVSVLSYLVLGPQELRRLAATAKLNTDDMPRIEFSAPRNLYRENAVSENWAKLASCRSEAMDDMIEFGAAGRDPAFRASLADAMGKRYDADFRPRLYLPWIQQELSKAIALAPRRADLYERLARVELRMRDRASARAHVEKALGLDPRRRSAWDLLARIGQ
jgi:spermidine synthase